MSKPWDAIIVGAGIGGLTAAALLAKAGLRVILFDRNSHFGGTAYRYQRKGFIFPMGPIGFSTPALVRDILKRMNQDELELHRIQYQIIAFDLAVPLAFSFFDMIEELSRLFPGEASSVARFFQDVETIASAIQFQEVIVIRTGADYSHFAKYRSGWRKRLPEYDEYKVQLGKALLQEAQHLIPGLKNSVRVMDIATPLTFEDQGGRNEGAVAGWSRDFEDWKDYHPRSYHSDDQTIIFI